MIKKIISLFIILSMMVVFIPITTNKSNAASSNTKTINILFIGNSKTYYNNMPAMLSNMLSKSGQKNNYKVLAKGSMSLNFHYHYIKNNPEQMKKLFNNEKIDYLILNEQTDVQLVPYGTEYNSNNDPDPNKNYDDKTVFGNLSVDVPRLLRILNTYDMISKEETKIILNSTWSYSSLLDEEINTTISNFELTKEAIIASGYTNCEIAYSGTALKKVSDEMNRPRGTLTKQELFSDERHTTQLGSYIEALAIYKAMFNSNMVANNAGSVSAEKMQKSKDNYVIINN